MATGLSSNCRQRRGGAAGLLEEETGLLDFGRGHDSAADYSDAVLLGGEGGGGGDPANHGGRIFGQQWERRSERREQDRQRRAMRVIFIRFRRVWPKLESAGRN